MDLSFALIPVILLTPAGFHTGPTLWSVVDGETVCQHLQVGKYTLSLFAFLCGYTIFVPAGITSCIRFAEMYTPKYAIHLTDAGPCELSSPGPVNHSTLIHHCQQSPVLFGSSAPLYPPPSLIPPPFIHLSLTFCHPSPVPLGRWLTQDPLGQSG